MNRREFLTGVGAGALATSGVGAWAGAEGKRPPNIILIMADDLGCECLGCYGSASYKTPHLDELAKDGMRFDHAHSQPLCTPTRVKIMTGQYNFRNYEAFGVLGPDQTTFAHVLKDAGYATCVVGKWQLYGRQEGWEGKGSQPEQAGFDEYCLWQIKGRGSRYADPMITQNGGPLERFEGQYGPDMFCEYLTSYMKRHRDEPFFVYYPMCLTHDPFVPTPDTEEWGGNRDRKNLKHFGDMVAYMDKIVGQIVRKVKKLGLQDNTLILFTGDNGTHKSVTSEMKDGRNIRGAKGQPTDAGTHVPLIANWKGVTPKGSVCDDLISFEDFLPTLAEAAGAPLPEDVPVDGRSFLAQIRGEKGNPRDWIFCHYDPQWGDRPRARFVRTKQWKLYDDGRFFDVVADPLEESPFAVDDTPAEGQAVRKALQGVLDNMK